MANLLVGAAEKLRNYLYFTARPRSVSPLAFARRRWEQRASVQLQRDGLFSDLLSRIQSRSRSTGSGYGDYLSLIEKIRSIGPDYVLECGSGISTFVIAYALWQNRIGTGKHGLVVSMDESPDYSMEAETLLPSWLQKYVEFHCMPRQEMLYRNHGVILRGVRYQEWPAYPYDFVYIDGPSERANPGATKCFNADVLHAALLSRGSLRALLDQRITTYLALRRLLPKSYVKYIPAKTLTQIVLNNDDVVSILVSKDSNAHWRVIQP